jgi:hypothetical protein
MTDHATPGPEAPAVSADRVPSHEEVARVWAETRQAAAELARERQILAAEKARLEELQAEVGNFAPVISEAKAILLQPTVTDADVARAQVLTELAREMRLSDQSIKQRAGRSRRGALSLREHEAA